MLDVFFGTMLTMAFISMLVSLGRKWDEHDARKAEERRRNRSNRECWESDEGAAARNRWANREEDETFHNHEEECGEYDE